MPITRAEKSAALGAWAEVDALKRQLAIDEAKVRAATEVDVQAIAGIIAGLSAYATHAERCEWLLSSSARRRLARKVSCTCGRNFELERALEWVEQHAPDVYRMVTGISPGDA